MADQQNINPFSDPEYGKDISPSNKTSNPFSDPNYGKEQNKGVKGHLQDAGASLMSGLAAVPDTLVGLADMYTEGRAGKAIDDNLGDYYKLGNAQNYWQDQKTDVAKQQQKQFHEADGIVNKAKVALENPSIIANTAIESVPSIFLSTAIGRASKFANPVVGAAVGEGAVMAGAQAEQIRQNSDDHMLNNGQEAAAALTGGLGALFGFAGGRIAQKLGIGDVDTMLVNGRVGPAQIAGEIANTPAKSLPRRVIEGAISEGFLEELPQSISEQIIQNLATDKHWSDGVEDAAVMGTLAGMAMGGVANIPSGHNSNTLENNVTPEQSQTNPVSPLPQLGGGSQSLDGEFIPRAEQQQNNADGNRTNYEYTQFNTDASNRLENNGFENVGTSDAPVNPQPNDGGSYFENPKPSERLGLNPDHGPMSSAAALAVDNGVSPITPDVATNTSLPSEYKQLLPQQNQNIYQSETNKSQNRKVDNQLAPKTDQNTISAKPIFSSTETAGTMSYANDITNQALEHYKNDNAELTDRKSSLTGKGAATDLIYYKNSPSFSNVEVIDEGDKSIVKLTNAKTGQVTEREYPQALVGFNNFIESNNANDLTQNGSATVDEVSKLEQQLLDTKSVVKKAQIRKQIETLKSQDLPQVENEQSQKSKAIELSANEAATSPLNDIPAPTQAQIEAGNYKKGHVRLHGLDITVENPKGSDRAGKRPDGTEWSHTMSDHYGYIKRTQGADSEQVDTYIGNNPDSDQVYIVDQLNQENGGFDEHKVMLGFDSYDAAIKAYKSNFDDGWKVGPVRSMNVAQFKDWLKSGDTTKPSVANKIPTKNEQKKLESTLNDVKTVNRAQVGYDLAKKSGNRIIYSDNKGQIDTADIVVNNFSVKGHEFYLALGTDKQSLGKYKVISEHGLTVGGFHATETDAMKAFNGKINSISDKQLQEAFERAGKTVQESGKSQDDLKQQFERSLYGNNTNDSPQKLAESSTQAKDFKVSNTKDSQSTIQDLGEKIGGARKDTSIPTGRTPKAKKSDDRPTWAKRYEISEIATSTNPSEVGKWIVEDTKKSDWKGNPKQLGKFDREEEAKQMLPILVVAQKHRIYARRESEGGYEIWRQINDTKRVKVVNEIFESKDSAQKYLVKNAISILETNTTFGESDIPRPESTTRHGIARRSGDVKDKDFMDVFGFRGVEFGNWNNQVERQQLLNDAYDGLLDLADVLKIPAKAISLNGDLALAFGARGQGLSSARAHYEPGKAVINLTKMNGAGSLAHEWWHAFDHFLARQDGKASAEWIVNPDGTRNLKVSKNSNDNMVSAGFSYRNSGVREDVRNAFNTVMETMTSKAEQFVEDTQQVDNFVGKARDLVSQRLDAIRKELERELDTKYYKRFNKAASTEQLVEFDSIAQQLRNGELLNTEWRSDVKNKTARGILSGARWTNDALEKLSSIYKAVRGRSGFSNEQKGILDQLRSAMSQYSSRLKLLAEAQQGTTKVKKIPTQFVMNAKDLDTGRGSDYWTTPHELSARAFQGFVEDKISEVSGKSPFLNYAPENITIETPWGWVRPFPHGKERKAINEKLDALVDTLKTESTNTGIKLYNRNSTLKPDNERSGASSFDTIFGTLSRKSATRQVLSIFQHLKLSTTQDTTTTHSIQVTDSSGVGNFTVQVISSFDGLPSEIQEAATYRDEDGNTQNYVVSGVWHGDTLYLVADGIEGDSDKQITTFEAYQETIIHEVIGHFGVQQIFGKEYEAKFQQLFNALGGLDGIRKIAVENGVDMQQFENAYIEPYTQGAADGIYESSDVQQALVGELFAFVAQNAEKKPFIRQKLKEIFGYIRQWLRDRGFMKLAQYNDADILMFIAEARKAVVDRRYFGKFKDQTISTNTSDKLFSRGQSATRTNTTVKQVRDKLVSRFGEATISKLEKQGKLNILDTYNDAGIEGFYQSGKATLIADALTDDTIVPTFLHELGGHGGFQSLMNQDQYKALMNQFNELVKRGNAIAVEAKQLAERESKTSTQQLEMLPYLLTLSSRMQVDNVIQKGAIRSLVNKIISAVKAWAFDRLGINLNLNPEDIVALAERMIRANEQFSTSQTEDALFSKQYDFNRIINRINTGIQKNTVTDFKKLASYKFTDWLGIGLSTLGRRQLTEIYRKLLPQLNKYNDLAAQMDAEKNDAGAEADQIVRDWAKLVDHNELAELMHDATLAKIDPAKPYVQGDSVSKYKQLRDTYRSLSPEAQSMYEQARDAYRKHYANVQQAIKERILRSELSSQKKADLLKQMDSQFYGYTKGVYFPLARFGKYVVISRDPNGAVESVSRAETMAEAQALRSELMQKYPHLKVERVILDKEFNASRDAVGRGFMTSLFAEVDNLGLSTAEQAEFEDTLSQLYLSSLPDLSWAKHGIHRKGTAGFSQDARRAFAQNMFHGAGYLAKLRYSDQLAEQLDQMQKYTTEQVKTNKDFDQPTAQRVIDEMNKRHDLLMNPKSHPLSSALTSLGFIYYLGLSPASAMVNLMQTPLVAYPVLGSKWGYDKAGKALIKASEQAIKGKNDISKSLSVEEKKAYDHAVNSGVIDVTQAHDLAGIAQGEDSGIMWKTRPVMRWASFLFHQAERFNREVTFIAAYRLARENGVTHDQAYEQATDATYKGHFDYSSGNRPRVMQGNVAKVMLLFKQFGQNMVYLLARQAHQAIKAESPQDRAQARRLLTGVLTTHALAAGVLGLPMVTTLLAAASMIGGDGDEPWDAEVALRNFLADIFGSNISNMIMKGASRGMPWDISGRVGLNNLILPDIQEGLEGQRLSESAMAAALGPVASIGTNVLKGAQEISEGQFERGIETMLPTFLRSPLKALRFADEGVQDKTGISIQDEVATLGLIGQAMGFSPSDVRTNMEGKSAIYQLNKKLDTRRAQLMAQWSRARLIDDTDRMDEVWEEIKQFNEKNPSRRINKINLNQSYKNRKNRIDKAEDGIYLSRNRQDAREVGRFAFGE
ncbi:PLxRFG domain-containing protein [uncultured Acinetobacter sp.]|uniref:PLxRFG domain-containing protein n=1 Tax=uncultured Acinetobacter sp. TaxID=165433 RepID=UPI00258F0BBD|nr:PLxRFG domain-containing protein [uncultured Acinetobacter sp.]